MLPVTTSLYVEQVGYDPTPKDFQSSAMTTSATVPKINSKKITKTIKNTILLESNQLLYVPQTYALPIELNTAK